MEKLKLNLDDLKVESFDTTPMQNNQSKGTVYGYNHTQEVGCIISFNGTCAPQLTCGLCTGQAGCSAYCGTEGCQNTQDGSTCLCW